MFSSEGSAIEFQTITSDFTHVYQRYFPRNLYELSDLSLASLTIWKDPYHVSWLVLEDTLCLRCQYRQEIYFLPPLGINHEQLPNVLRQLHQYCSNLGIGLRFRSVPSSMLGPMIEAFHFNARIIEDRPSWDYVYRTQDLLDLKGRKYQHQRQALRKFRQTHPYTYTPLESSDAPAIWSVFEAWAAVHPESETIEDERSALTEALRSQDTLGLKCGGLKIGSELIAFAIGSSLTPETALIHFEKGHPEYPGSYAAINWEFTANVWSHTQSINREDDLGLPNLREAKSRYHPIRMVEKYTIEIKEQEAAHVPSFK